MIMLRLCQVQYLVEDDIRPRRPTAIVDGRDGRVVMKWNSLSTLCPDAQGVGGNEKVKSTDLLQY